MSDPTTPYDVVVAALAVPFPCPVCGRAETCGCAKPTGWSPTTMRARLVVAALIEHGHLPDPDQTAPVTADYERAAQWLADQSGHPRYEGDGWARIMQSSRDVEMAHASADRRLGGVGREGLARTRAMLLDYHRTRSDK